MVAVVSAMGKTTDEPLVGLAASLNDNPPAREMDRLLSTGEQVSMTLLAMAIEARGYKAMSFTGRQAGIETDGTHAKAKDREGAQQRIMEALNRGVIAVVAGFQGHRRQRRHHHAWSRRLRHHGGRGGGARPGRRRVRDLLRRGRRNIRPTRACPRAKKLDRHLLTIIRLRLSSSGAGVLQMRAVEFARKYQVVIHSRSAFSDARKAPYIKEETDMMEEAVITGIAP